MSEASIQLGHATIHHERPASCFGELAAAVERALKRPFPDPFARFFQSGDGLRVRVTGGDGGVLVEEEIVGVQRMFAGFAKHRQLKNEEAFEEFSGGELYDAPFCGEIWSEDFTLEERGDLTRFNTMLRAKLLVSVAGRSEALAVDFFPKAKKGEKVDYQLLWIYEGNDCFVLDLDFDQFVDHFAHLGAQGWPMAYLPKGAAKKLNIDLAVAVEDALAPFAVDQAERVAGLLARVRRG
jgi:hypothetical protein